MIATVVIQGAGKPSGLGAGGRRPYLLPMAGGRLLLNRAEGGGGSWLAILVTLLEFLN